MNIAKIKNMFIIILCIFIFNIINPDLTISASGNIIKYDITISCGIDGKYKLGKYIPINIKAKNLKEDFNGEVEVRVTCNNFGGYDSYSKEIVANKGEDINISIPIKFLGEEVNITAYLIKSGKVLCEKKVILSSGRIIEGNMFVGLLTDDDTSLGYLGDIAFSDTNYPNISKMNLVKLNRSLLNLNGLNIDGLDLIIINNYNMANLKKSDYNSLNTWINKGGTLLIGTGASESKTINNIDTDFLNVDSNGSITSTVRMDSESLDLLLSQITLDKAKVITDSFGEKLAYSLERGSGRIVVTTFDLGIEPFISSNISSLILQNILLETMNKIYELNYDNNYYNDSYEISSILNTIPIENRVSVVTLGILLSIYAVFIGIILYFILKNIKQRDFIWIFIPITAVVFTTVIYILGSGDKINNTIVNKLNIIDIDKDGKGKITGYIGFSSKSNKNIIVEKDQNLNMNHIYEDYYYSRDINNNENKKLITKTTYTKDNTYFTIANNISDITSFEVLRKEIVLPKIENNLKITNGNLEGSIKNNLDSDIKKLIVISGQGVWEIGNINKGEEITISNLKISNSSGIQSYADGLNIEYYNSKQNNFKSSPNIKFKNVKRYACLLNLLGNKDFIGDGSKIIAITDLPIDYGFNLKDESISNYDLTAIIQETTIDFSVGDGNIIFPEGYFKYDISYEDPNIKIDTYNNCFWGNGDIILDYKVNDNVKVKEIGITAHRDRSGYQLGIDGEYYIYNYNLNQYERFSLSSGNYKVVDDGSYTLDNIIRIKVVCDDTETSAPQLTIKGVEK